METIEVRGGRVSIRILDTRFVRLMNLISIVNALQRPSQTGGKGREEVEGKGSNETLNGRSADGGSLLLSECSIPPHLLIVTVI